VPVFTLKFHARGLFRVRTAGLIYPSTYNCGRSPITDLCLKRRNQFDLIEVFKMLHRDRFTLDNNNNNSEFI